MAGAVKSRGGHSIILGPFRGPCSQPPWSVPLPTGRQVCGPRALAPLPPASTHNPPPQQPDSKAVRASSPTANVCTPGPEGGKAVGVQGCGCSVHTLPLQQDGAGAAREGRGQGPTAPMCTLGRSGPVWATQHRHHSGEKWADPGGVQDVKSLGVSER